MESYARQNNFDIVLHLQAVSHHQDQLNPWVFLGIKAQWFVSSLIQITTKTNKDYKSFVATN